MQISTQQNPTYFNDVKNPSRFTRRIAHPSHSPIPSIRRRGALESFDDEESEVFLSNPVDFRRDYNVNMSKSSGNRCSSIDRENRSSGVSPKKKQTDSGIGFGKKFTQLFWKPKSKSSVESDNSSFTGMMTSSKCTSDSSPSIYSNSLDSDSHSSTSTSNSTHSDPVSPFYMNTQMDDELSTYSFDDCQSYTTNMYYNVGEGSSFLSRTDGRPRINSVPFSSKTLSTTIKLNPNVDEEGPHLPYYNTNFSTFTNPRRHSIAASSTSSSNFDNSVESSARDGYLVPIRTEMSVCTRNSNNLYINESRGEDFAQLNVHADIHTPTSSDALHFGFNESSPEKNLNLSHHELQQQSSNDSSATMVDGTAAMASCSQEKLSRNKTLPSSKRVVPSGKFCEPYCSLCAASAQTPTTPFSIQASRMDVAIVSCQECFFSQRAEEQLKGLFLKSTNSEVQKLDVRLSSYDLKEIDQHKFAAEVHRSKVQIVIISNHFLDRLRHEATVRKKISPLNRVLRPNRVVAVLVSLSSKDILEGCQNVLARFPEWHSVELKAIGKLDAEFCKAFTDQVTRIYNIEASSISQFSVFPKKVTKEQPKVVIMFKKPIDSNDSVRVELTRGNHTEIVEGIISTNPYTTIIRIPGTLCADRTALIEVTVFINATRLGAKLIKCEYQVKQVEEDVIERMTQALPSFRKILDEHISQRLSQDFRSNEDFTLDPTLELMNDALLCRGDEFPTMMHFAAYYGLEQTVWVLLEEGDGLEQCSVVNDMRETPLAVAQSKGFQATIGKTIKDYQEVTVSWRAFQYMKDLYERHSDEAGENNNEEHFSDDVFPSAEEELVYSNVDFTRNLDLDNVGDETEQHHEESDENLETEIALSPELTENTLSEPKNFSHPEQGKLFAPNSVLQTYDVPPPPVLLFETKSFSSSELIYYDTPRPSQEDYCIPPSDPKPVLPEKPQKVPVLTKKTDTISSDPDGYIFVESSQSGTITSTDLDIVSPNELAKVEADELENHETKPRQPSTSTQAPVTKQVVLDPTEEELVELMNGFKNNVYSMRELELLFENWKTRSDVQRDIRDKQNQLNLTREHYKKIQESIRRNNKNSGALYRFLKFIPGSKKKHSAEMTIAHPIAAPGREDSGRKISSESTNGESHIGTSPSNSDPASTDSSSESGKGPVFWKNPLDRRFVTSYVAPNQQPVESKAEDNVQEAVSSPPPRPFKKPSLIADCPTLGQSPPLSPFLNKRPAPLPPSASPQPVNEKASKSLKKGNKGKVVQPPAPPPPPRSTKNQQLSYVSYKSNGLNPSRSVK